MVAEAVMRAVGPEQSVRASMSGRARGCEHESSMSVTASTSTGVGVGAHMSVSASVFGW